MQIHPDPKAFLDFIGVLAIVGVAIWAFMKWKKYTASKDWPTAPGVIGSVKCLTGRGGAPLKWALEISYSYLVQEQRYAGFEQVACGSGKEIDAIYGEYPAGKDVLIYYDPAKPARSVLRPGIRNPLQIFLGP
jgi:Protein of unknown function (DUF3592)